MADLTKSIDSLVSDMSEAARKEVADGLRPALRKLGEALAELEAGLDAVSKPSGRKRRGRPPGSGRKTAKPGAKAGRKRTPRGALQEVIRDVLGKSGKALKLSQIRDGVLKSSTFKGRDPKTLYKMIVFAVKKMPDVSRTSAGLYGLKAGKRPSKKMKSAGGRKKSARK